MTVEPGPRVTVASVALDVDGAARARAAPTRDEPGATGSTQLRETWPLRARRAVSPGRPGAAPRTATLGAPARRRLSDRDLAVDTAPRIDAADNRADARARRSTAGRCSASATIRIEGLQRYDEDAVRRAGDLRRGDVYSEKLLLDYQERLHQARPVRRRLGRARRRPARRRPRRCVVKVKELTPAPGHRRHRLQRQHRAARVARALRPQRLRPALDRAQQAQLGPDQKLARQPSSPRIRSRTCTATWSPPTSSSCAPPTRRATAWTRARRPLAGHDRASSGCTTSSWRRRAVDSAPLDHVEPMPSRSTTTGCCRDVDNVLLPTDGVALSLQGGVGYGTGAQKRSDLPASRRATARSSRLRALHLVPAVRRAGTATRASRPARCSSHNRIGVPDTILFRAGGDDSVRGYDYRTLGPIVNGAVVGGRVLLDRQRRGRAADHRARCRRCWARVFVDAGNAADRWSELHPVVRLRRRPALAQPGRAAAPRRRLRPGRCTLSALHLSVGIAF